MNENKIKKLTDAVVNRIAAGEVVEKPASVIKELVENSLDAGARSVLVEFEDGGRTRMRVLDDGGGMSAADARLSLERHATSKIDTERDLETIRSFGFRGEALPSIQSISRFDLRSRRGATREEPGDEVGLWIHSEGGSSLTEQQVAMPPGTDIELRELFFNVPARRKFLKADRTEASHIVDTVKSLALAHPPVRFSLRSGTRTVFDLAPDDDLLGRARAVFGAEIARGLFPLEHVGGVRLQGLLGRPDLTRRSPGNIYLFVNRRYVRDRMLQRAVMDGYGALVDKGSWPTVLLFVDVDPGEVDVNVHPTKAEVRFTRGGSVFHELRSAVAGLLASSPWLDGAVAGEGRYPVGDDPGARGGGTWEQPRTGYARWFNAASEAFAGEPGAFPGLPGVEASQEGLRFGAEGAPAEGDGYFSSLRYVGQVGATFLVCETSQDLVILDQHAAHERVTFERLRKRYGERQGAEGTTQRLLVPLRLELPEELAPIAEQHAEALETLGFHLRPFGGRSFVVEEVPDMLGAAPLEPLILDLLDELRATESVGAFSERVDHVLSRVACHASVRAGDSISPHEARALLVAMDQIDFSANCPHGRPVVISHSFNEVAKWFDRT